MLERIKNFFRNHSFYAWGITIFLGLTLVLGRNNVFVQLSNFKKLKNIEAEIADYDNKIKELDKNRQETFGNTEAIETFAREKYLMKKPNETVFVIVDEQDKSIEKAE